MAVIESPKPGSREATELRCSCDPTNNDCGNGFRGNPAWYLIRRDCPLHGIDRIDKLVDLLKGIEWVQVTVAGVSGKWRCLWCQGLKDEGHKVDCPLFLVLYGASER